MQPYVSVITLGTRDLKASRSFYVDGFRWSPAFENDEIVFYPLNGLVLGTWLTPQLEADMRRPGSVAPAAVALAHNVRGREEVEPLLERLVKAGGRLLRAADAPPHGGFRGYVADPDGHAWEIAWNPAWAMDAQGNVTFGV
ncbi:VOC family protein [Phenylobacterium sp.]|uniref:VOC family protein n=1 Tax=Phenylobacterium sp. TaxID=1871053 RepID=UPI0035B35FA0